MKYIFFTLLLIPFFTYSQTIEKDKVDDFTGTRIITTSNESLSMLPQICLVNGAMAISGKDTVTALVITAKPGFTTSINDNSKVFFKLDNSEIVTLSNQTGYDLVSSEDYLTWTLQLEKQSIKKLKDAKVLRIRFDTSQGNFDLDVNPKATEAIAGIIRLIEEKKKTL